MTDLTKFLKRRTTIAELLKSAGMQTASIKNNRAFASRWGWEDGVNAFVTVWMDEIDDPRGRPSWRRLTPSVRTDITNAVKRRKAGEVYDLLERYRGKPFRVILQRRAPGEAPARGLDPEPWFAIVSDDHALLQRGHSPHLRDISITGEPMTPRAPTFALRETRPEQVRFRETVAIKTAHRCALTGVPSELCDAAHFPWADWRTDNQAHHGLLLRRDLHAALDCGLLDIDPNGLVAISAYLGTMSRDYAALHGRTVPVW